MSILLDFIFSTTSRDSPTELSNDEIDDSLAALFLSDILGDGEANASGLIDEALSLLRVDFLLGKIDDSDVGSLEGEHHRGSSSDSRVAT